MANGVKSTKDRTLSLGSLASKKNKEMTSGKTYELLGSKIPPHSNDAEIAVLGAIMIDKQAIPKVVEIIEPDSFYNEAHKVIYQNILNLFERGTTVDIVTLSEELYKNKMLDFIGGTYYLTEINAITPTSANIEHYARIVQEKYLKRCLINAAGRIIVNSYDEGTDALEEVDTAEHEIFKIAEKRFSRSFVEIKDLTFKAVDMITKLLGRNTSGLSGIPSGFKDLDKLLGGFQNSDLIVIAARPSMGKTALALSIARNIAVEYKLPIGFFSIEMSDIQLAIRLISAESQINAQKIRTGDLRQDDLTKIVHKIGRLADSPLFIDDSPALSIMELRAKCRRLKTEHQVKAIMVDYLQLLHPPKAETREREISIISSSLKQIAKELDIPVITLAQLNRGVESRGDKRPMLSDLRESGSIEQDADVVMFIYRPDFYGIKTYPNDQKPTANTAEIIVAKQRNGPTDSIRLAYLKDFARFENLEERYDEPPIYEDENEEEPPF